MAVVAFAFQSPHNLCILDPLNYAAIRGIMFFLGCGESFIGILKLTEIGDLKNC